MSGMTRSMPSIPSSGNMRPASTTTMSSPTSIASMFLPISPTPPSGITRSDVFDLAKERYLLHRLFLRLFRRWRGREEQRQRREIGVERIAQSRLMQRRGGGVHGEDQEAIGGPFRVGGDGRDPIAREELPPPPPRQGGDGARVQSIAKAGPPQRAPLSPLLARVA